MNRDRPFKYVVSGRMLRPAKTRLSKRSQVRAQHDLLVRERKAGRPTGARGSRLEDMVRGCLGWE